MMPGEVIMGSEGVLMKIISWNINGIRSALKKGLVDSLLQFDADIICLQEVRARPEQFQLELPEFQQYFNPAEKAGYSGTAILSKFPFISMEKGLLVDGKIESEGRMITAELPAFYLVNVYTPNSQRGLTRLDYRVHSWDKAFQGHIKKLMNKKPVVLCGDLNVAHKEIDLANPDSNHHNAGFTDEERNSFSKLLDLGIIDTFREFCHAGGHYTWWSNFFNSRAKNIGWRIDYFCISKNLCTQLIQAEISPKVMGSDHCPISIDLTI